MKSYKQFHKGKEIEVGVIPAPIHFKHTSNHEVPSPIHFKHMDLEEERAGNYDAWKDTNENSHLGHTNNGIRKKLTTGHDLTNDERINTLIYTRSSKPLNKKLIERTPLTGGHKDMASSLDSAIARHPMKHKLHVYSGLSFNPEEHTDEHGKMHSPAYISATHSKDEAHSFTTQHRGIHHIARITLHPGDPAIHVSPYSASPHEDETIIKRGVTLQHHGSSDYTDPEGFRYRVHNMSIAK